MSPPVGWQRRQFGRPLLAAAGDDQRLAVAPERVLGGEGRRSHDAWRAAGGGHTEHRHVPRILPVEVDRLVVGRPCQLVHAAVEARRHLDVRLRLAVVLHQPPSVGFVAGTALRAIREPLAVGRVGGRAVERRVVGDPRRRFLGAVGLHDEDVAVGADGLHRVGDRDKGDLAAIRRERDRMRPLTLHGRHVVSGARRQVSRRAAADGHHEQVRPLTGAPGGPVAVEQAVVCPRLHRVLLLALALALVARVVGAVGPHRRGEGQRLAIGRPHDLVGAAVERGQLRRLASGEVEQVDLLSPVSTRQKRQARSVRRPARAAVAAGEGQLPRCAAGESVRSRDCVPRGWPDGRAWRPCRRRGCRLARFADR